MRFIKAIVSFIAFSSVADAQIAVDDHHDLFSREVGMSAHEDYLISSR
jgi:hypothetical protein